MEGRTHNNNMSGKLHISTAVSTCIHENQKAHHQKSILKLGEAIPVLAILCIMNQAKGRATEGAYVASLGNQEWGMYQVR